MIKRFSFSSSSNTPLVEEIMDSPRRFSFDKRKTSFSKENTKSDTPIMEGKVILWIPLVLFPVHSHFLTLQKLCRVFGEAIDKEKVAKSLLCSQDNVFKLQQQERR